MQRGRNWQQPPLPTARRPSRANDGAPVPASMVALPFLCLITSVRPTPVPRMSHPVHLYHPVHPYVPYSQLPASVPVHKSQFFQSSSTIQSNPAGQYAPQEPMVALPFRCLLTSVWPSPFPPMSHPFHLSHLSHFSSYQPPPPKGGEAPYRTAALDKLAFMHWDAGW